MARYIIIDNRSGYVVHDTAGTHVADPIAACRLHNANQNYRIVSSLRSTMIGYRVYEADNIPLISNYRHPHLIELIETECPLVASIRIAE